MIENFEIDINNYKSDIENKTSIIKNTQSEIQSHKSKAVELINQLTEDERKITELQTDREAFLKLEKVEF